MVNGLVVDTQGNLSDFTKSFNLDTVREALKVDQIELISLTNGLWAYVDEEGAFNGAKENPVGREALFSLGFPRSAFYQNRFNGGILFFGGIDDEGDDLPLSESQEEIIRAAFALQY